MRVREERDAKNASNRIIVAQERRKYAARFPLSPSLKNKDSNNLLSHTHICKLYIIACAAGCSLMWVEKRSGQGFGTYTRASSVSDSWLRLRVWIVRTDVSTLFFARVGVSLSLSPTVITSVSWDRRDRATTLSRHDLPIPTRASIGELTFDDLGILCTREWFSEIACVPFHFLPPPLSFLQPSTFSLLYCSTVRPVCHHRSLRITYTACLCACVWKRGIALRAA